MAQTVNRGEIWRLALQKPDKTRPVLVLSRQSLLRVLHTATVAAITSTLRDSPTEVRVGVDSGLKHESCINLVNIFTVPKSQLRGYVGRVSPKTMREICRALNIAVGCET